MRGGAVVTAESLGTAEELAGKPLSGGEALVTSLVAVPETCAVDRGADEPNVNMLPGVTEPVCPPEDFPKNTTPPGSDEEGGTANCPA